ncbi:molybdopterin-dependent oxidoreductase [Luteolibacter algae]|uniref:Molybdopterin-dependent oxidoreductase n=1 Tax=Luteolibacter algae TaxID=454151 RepID=A0ABW5DAC9_9BACT
MNTRRTFLQQMGMVGASLAGSTKWLKAAEEAGIELPFENGSRVLKAFPGKRPLIVLTSRPPQLETPFEVFNGDILTPNDAFYVRYHLAGIPLSVDTESFRLKVKGSVKNELSLSLKNLKEDFEQVETVAVAQCSGNSRGFMQPRVGGGQLANGAMGNARWQGVRLKDLLEKAGISPESQQVSFDGMDQAIIEQTPDFVKSLGIEQIMDGEVMVAHTMNGEDLPMLNGFPLRLVVPGYYATYWIKHLHEITVLEDEFEGFWMKSAYRIPETPNACLPPGQSPASTVPINRMNVRSFITSHLDGATVKKGEKLTIRGIAFDGGEGIKEVQFSPDGGRSWRTTMLGEDLGRYSFREWTVSYSPEMKGVSEWKVRAINRVGESQPFDPLYNPSGYMRNVVETTKIKTA